MTDARLRALMRAARDDPIAQAQVLAERVRVGTLTQERLELAAYVGHAAARAALGSVLVEGETWREPAVTGCTGVAAAWCPLCGDCECPTDEDGGYAHGKTDPRCPLHRPGSTHAERGVQFHGPSLVVPQAFDAWVRGLVRWGLQPQVRAQIAAAEVVYARMLKRDPYADRMDEVIRAARAWAQCPCDEHRVAWGDAWLATQPAVGEAARDWLPRPANEYGGWKQDGAVLHCLVLVGAPREPLLRAAIRDALSAWALA